MFLETTGGKFWASIFKLTTIFVPLAAILAIISASSIVIQAVGIFFTPFKQDVNTVTITVEILARSLDKNYWP